MATQALDIKISRKKISIVVGIFSMCAVILFLFAEDFATLLDSWVIAIAAWVATWGGIMAVHYFVFERRQKNFGYLFLSPRDSRLKAANPRALIAFGAGLVMTWLFMYGALPIFQGPIATAMGGVDLSWLAGSLTSGALYFALAYPRFRSRLHHGVPLGLKVGVDDQAYLAAHGDAALGDGVLGDGVLGEPGLTDTAPDGGHPASSVRPPASGVASPGASNVTTP